MQVVAAVVAAVVVVEGDKMEVKSYIKRRFWLEKARHLKKGEVDIVFEHVITFMTLASEGKKPYLTSYIVDEAWHTFILFTSEYVKFCQDVFGKYIHHSPSISNGGYKDDLERIFATWDLYESRGLDMGVFSIDQKLKITGSDYKPVIKVAKNLVKINGVDYYRQ